MGCPQSLQWRPSTLDLYFGFGHIAGTVDLSIGPFHEAAPLSRPIDGVEKGQQIRRAEYIARGAVASRHVVARVAIDLVPYLILRLSISR